MLIPLIIKRAPNKHKKRWRTHFQSSFLLNNQKLINKKMYIVIFVSFSRLIDQNVFTKTECSNQSSKISSRLLHTGKARLIFVKVMHSEVKAKAMWKRFKMKRFGTGLRLVNDVTKANSELISNLLAKEDIESHTFIQKPRILPAYIITLVQIR